MRILAANPDSLGDLILRQPLYGALAAAGHELMLIIRGEWAEVAPAVAPTARFITLGVNPYEMTPHSDWSVLQPVLDAARQFAPDLFLIAPFQWTSVEEWLARNLAPARVASMSGYSNWGSASDSQSSSSFRFDQTVEIAEVAAELAKNQALASLVLGQEVHLPDPRLESSAPAIDSARDELARLDLSPGDYWFAVVGHDADKAVRNWRLENWAKALEHWTARHGRKFLLAGSEEERQTSQTIRATMSADAAGAIRIPTGPISLATMMGLIHLSRGYVGRDTGPMHIAAAMGKPVIALFGGGTWPRFQPAAAKCWISMVDVPCAGCGWCCPFDVSHCVKDVPVAGVIEAIDAMESGRLTGRNIHLLPTPQNILPSLTRQASRQVTGKTREIARLKHFESQQVASLQRDLAAQQEESRQLASQLQDSSYHLQARLDAINAAHLRQEQLKAELAGKEGELTRRDAELQALKSDLSAKGIEIAQKTAQFAATEADFAAKLQAAQADVATLERIRAQLQSDLGRERLTIEQLSARLAEIATFVGDLSHRHELQWVSDRAATQILLDIGSTLDQRLRLLLTSRLMRLGWKIGLGQTPAWAEPSGDPIVATQQRLRAELGRKADELGEGLHTLADLIEAAVAKAASSNGGAESSPSDAPAISSDASR